MVEIPDRLRCLFAARVNEREGSYVIEVPESEIEKRSITTEETYRVVVLPDATTERTEPTTAPDSGATEAHEPTRERSETRTPPVEEGETRTVSIEAVGDQGDGIAKVERGYVVIVPEAAPGEEVRVEIEQVRPNVSFARVIEDNGRPSTEPDADEPEPTDSDSNRDAESEPDADERAADPEPTDDHGADPNGATAEDRDPNGDRSGEADDTTEE